ncbi:MAG TPA: hypothetical protein VGQ59_20905 [Cyclobacteriaceae bacterium]|jgi:hypothetical protein|nr:hypothetical protein [Cyclobacteriaceae bacterium]
MDKFQFDINQFFRYLLSGGWAIACYFFICPKQISNIPDGSWLIMGILAMVLGFVIHVIYRAIFYPLWYKVIYGILSN